MAMTNIEDKRIRFMGKSYLTWIDDVKMLSFNKLQDTFGEWFLWMRVLG